LSKWLPEVQKWSAVSSHVARAVRSDLAKGRYRPEYPKHGLRSLTEDPLSIQYSLGYKDRKYSLTYNVIRQVVQNLAIVSSIINLRTMQIAAFGAPYRVGRGLGYVIRHKDAGKLTSKGEMKMIKDIEQFIYNCGAKDPNPYNESPARDDFETFLKKLVRDSLMYDQACFEVVPDRRGLPYEFAAVDSSTIRLAKHENMFGPGADYHNRPPAANNPIIQNNQRFHPYNTLQMYADNKNMRPAYVQVVNGQIENVYTQDEMAFGVRNPRSDIYIQGYGYGEIEQLITIITSHLYAEEYNRRFFMQGSAPKGILNLRGDTMDTNMLEGFKREWRANLEGVENAWRTPIFQSEQGIDWIPLAQSNRDMEYGQWVEYLVKITCGVFLVDPAELNFDISGGVSQTPLFESSAEWKLKASRDKGLKPLLRFVAKLINDNIVAKIDDHFVFDFVGLDELSEQEKHELRKEQVSTYMTMNEVRREMDLPDVENGDVISNPAFIQAVSTVKQEEMQEKQMAQQQQQEKAAQAAQSGGGPAASSEEEAGASAAGAEQQGDMPLYADNFTKAIAPASREFVEIIYDEALDEWHEEYTNA
jgi:hypothetical protein